MQPVVAVKLTGKGLGTDIGLLSAVDDRAASATGDHPFYNLLRLQRDIGASSRLGLVYTDRIDGGNSNRVGGVDGRFVRGAYSAQFQVAGSRTTTAGVTTTGPLFFGRFIANGHTFGFRASFNGSDPDFRARSGFFPRTGLSHINFQPRVSFYGKSGSLMENLTVDLNLDGVYRYDQFATNAGMQEEKVHLNANLILYGGWHVGASVLIERFGYPSEVYTDYRLEVPRAGGGADTVAFVGQPEIPNRDYVFTLDTPEFAHFSGSLFTVWGHDENFYEWASGQILWVSLGLKWRPTDQLRLDANFDLNQVHRRTDGSMVHVNYIPRVKIEYQASRPIFIRLVGEYTSDRQSPLRDDSRTGAPILIFDPDAGDFVRTTAFTHKSFRGDILFSYQPSPGTVLFAGYGSTLRDPVDPTDPLRTGLHRSEDGFFFKVSYLFRM